jgi:predicted transcriptional regulator of viral defense system
VDNIAKLRRNIRGEVFDYHALLDVLSDYRKPRDRITRLLASGNIIRIKKGLYCFGEAFRKEPLSREYMANLIYGPSYVSLDYALSFHGLIPERVETVTSVTTRRSRFFNTPFGTYSYRMLNHRRYAVGAMFEKTGNTPFLVASPEKALADKVWADKRFNGLRVSEYEAYLYRDLRIDRQAIRYFDHLRLQAVATAYGSAKINKLVHFLTQMKDSSHA